MYLSSCPTLSPQGLELLKKPHVIVVIMTYMVPRGSEALAYLRSYK